MSDPIKGLESFDREGPTVHPLPAAEARRLGDRLRRRNTALAVLGAVVAVVVIAAPIAALTRGEDHAAPQPTSPTSTGSPTPTSPVTPNGVDIPAGFPLLAGYPANSQSEGGSYGREGPNRTLAPVVPEACGVLVPLPPYTDLLRAGWNNVEDFRARQVVTFPDDAQAQAYADAVRDVYRACPREDTADGNTTVNTVVDTDLAESSAAVVTHYELAGSPAIGLNTLVVVRSGRAVLVATTYSEGGPGPDPAGIAQDAAAEVEDVISAMCRFREGNC